jgi:hypothetical protein
MARGRTLRVQAHLALQHIKVEADHLDLPCQTVVFAKPASVAEGEKALPSINRGEELVVAAHQS